MTDRNPKPGEYWRTTADIVRTVAEVYDDRFCRMKDGIRLHRDDLIERVVVVPDPHPEPRVWWVTLSRGTEETETSIGLWASKEEADRDDRLKSWRIACVRVTEGQFDAD